MAANNKNLPTKNKLVSCGKYYIQTLKFQLYRSLKSDQLGHVKISNNFCEKSIEIILKKIKGELCSNFQEGVFHKTLFRF